MCDKHAFLCDWHFWIEIASVLATLLLGYIAVWGDALKAKWVGPRLRIQLQNYDGHPISFSNGSPSRWYHITVTNSRRTSPAHNVRVVLLDVVRPAADGSFPAPLVHSRVPMKWQHGHSAPASMTVGPPTNADIGFVSPSGFVLNPEFVPNDIDPALGPGGRYRVRFIAVSDETESNTLSLEIAWNGQWSDDTNTMRRNLTIQVV